MVMGFGSLLPRRMLEAPSAAAVVVVDAGVGDLSCTAAEIAVAVDLACKAVDVGDMVAVAGIGIAAAVGHEGVHRPPACKPRANIHCLAAAAAGVGILEAVCRSGWRRKRY